MKEMYDFKEILDAGERVVSRSGEVSYFLFGGKAWELRKENDFPLMLRKENIYSVVMVGKGKSGKEYCVREIHQTGRLSEMPLEDFMEFSKSRSLLEQVLRERPEWAKELGLYPSHSIYQ